MRQTALLAALLASAAAFAAPVPPRSEKERIARQWGKIEGEGEFSLDGKRLTMRTIGKPARGGILRSKIDMLRVTRNVTGDFEATVAITDAALPAAKNKYEGTWPGTRAGVFIQGGGYAIELHFYQFHPKLNGVVRAEPTRCVWIDTWYPRGGQGTTLKQIEAGKSPYLRITRKGNDISVSYSLDGKEWSKPYTPRVELAFPEELTVGVFFSQSTYQIASATFEHFTVTKSKSEK